MTTPFTVFDIETRPDPEAVERFTKPYPAFNEAEVKFGNTKDPVKRKELVEQKRADHEAGKEPYWKEAHEKAALSPFTGKVVVIGLMTHEGRQMLLEGQESNVLTAFWTIYRSHAEAVTKFCYWSGSGSASKGFDIDYIVTRSRILGVSLPVGLRKGRYYSDRIVDLASEFLLYQSDAYLSLSRAAGVMGLFGDMELTPPINAKCDDDDVTGANFYQWYDGKADGIAAQVTTAEQQRAFALSYLKNDLNLTYHLAKRIL